MSDYAKLYHRLFHAQTQAIEILQKAQQDAEDMYIEAPEPEIRVLERNKPGEDKQGAKRTAPDNPAAKKD